ncbi:MAG: tetratricopeptide repeat protein [Burkholderiales bacterium]
MRDPVIAVRALGAHRGSRWQAVACISLALAHAVTAADINGYLEETAKRQAQESVSAGMDEVASRARAGEAEAQYQLGMAYRNGWGTKPDALAAVIWLREAADQGHARAQHVLGSMYEAGEGVPVSLEKARAWYTKSADSGFAEAQRSLARLTRQGSDAVPRQ